MFFHLRMFPEKKKKLSWTIRKVDEVNSKYLIIIYQAVSAWYYVNARNTTVSKTDAIPAFGEITV